MFRKFQSFIKSIRLTAPPESVYFYTLHKCASSLFGDYVLKHVRGLRLMDYADRFYNGDPVKRVTFEDQGFIYGPIRLSTGPTLAIYNRLIEPASRPDFIRDKIAIFLIRDPRDILVSSYYSFGYTHEFSTVKEIEERQRQLREVIRGKTIDAFVLEAANATLNHFNTLDRLAHACSRGIILKYEDMIDNWEEFAAGLTKHLDISRKVLRQIYQRSRPRQSEEQASHHRCGKPGGFMDKLPRATIDVLNGTFSPVLTRFDYEA